MNITITFCKASNTIRQYPENYLLASWNGHNWVMEPDLASNRELVVALTLSLMEHENKYSDSPIPAIIGITDHMTSSYEIR